MTDPDLVRLFVGPLESLGLSYMITGGVASVVYGDPRFTRDVDLVLDLPAGAVGRFENAFAGEAFYVPPPEVLAREVARPEGGHFNLIHRDTALRADVYLAGADPFHAWALERRRRIDLDDLSVWLAPIEYVVVRKLEYCRVGGSERHLRDVAMMLRVSGDLVDDAALQEWSTRREVSETLERARAFDPDLSGDQ